MKAKRFWLTLGRVSVISLSLVGLLSILGLKHSAPVVKAQSALGLPIPNLSLIELTMFDNGIVPVAETWNFTHGLGPVFTQNSCSVCHSDPVLAGNSVQKTTFFGKLNSDGSFNPLTSEGGMLLQPNSVSSTKKNCFLAGEVVPSDATIVVQHQAPPAFGMGLIDSIPTSAILAQAVDKGMGVHGIANMVPDQNGNIVVGKYGYKAQLATLLQTVATAMGHDVGITNPIVPAEDLPQGKAIPPNCSITIEPNDDGTQMMNAFHYLLYLAPNPPPQNVNVNGKALFSSVGCALCHMQTYTTGDHVTVQVKWQGSSLFSKALSKQPVNLYSDLLLHDMGPILADNLPMSLASGSMFRTIPLWGLSRRIESGDGLLHDGRTSDVTTAILDHGGEASQVVGNFTGLSPADQGDLISFISSL